MGVTVLSPSLAIFMVNILSIDNFGSILQNVSGQEKLQPMSISDWPQMCIYYQIYLIRMSEISFIHVPGLSLVITQ